MSTKWKDYYGQLKLKEKLRLLFLSLTAGYLLIIILVLFVLVADSSTDYLKVSSKTLMESSTEKLNASFENISNITKLIMNNKEIQNYYLTKNDIGSNAISYLKQTSAFFPDVYSVFLITDENTYLTTGRDRTKVRQDILEAGEWKKELDARKGGYVVRLNGSDIFSMNTDAEIISFMRKVYYTENQKSLGYLVVNVPMSVLDDARSLTNEGNQQYSFIDLDGRRAGNLGNMGEDWELSERNERYIQRIKREPGGMKIMSVMNCANSSIYVKIIDEVSFVQLAIRQVNMLWVLFALTTVAGFVWLGIFIKKHVTGPIEKLCMSMETVKTGYFHRVSLELPNDEIGMLKDTYNEMLVETNHLIEEIVEQETKIQKAELMSLQEQIKPHFLYNTLDTICYMVMETEKEDVYDAVETLGNFYRKFLNKGKEDILLKEEIGIVRDYLTLQKLRYEDVFEDIYELPNTIPDIRIPKLILQPLVENSIYHGVRLKGEKGVIKVTVTEDMDSVFLTVWDSGVGMSEEETQNFLYKDNGQSFGFKGTIERLKYYYRRQDVCEVRSVKGEFFQVTLKLPK